MKISYVHVDDQFQPGPPCRFCDDPSNINNKSQVVQTGTAMDGRPLYAHPECDNPFEFGDRLKTISGPQDLHCPNCGDQTERPGFCPECSSFLEPLDGPNPVDVDFFMPTAKTEMNYVHPQPVGKLPSPAVDAVVKKDVKGLGPNGEAEPELY